MFFLFFFSLLLLSRHHCAEVYEISPAQPLSEGQTLVSPSLVFELGFFSPNNDSGKNKYVGIWHKSIFPRKVVWVANRENPVAASDTLAMPSNGSAAALLDSGNFVVKDDDVGADPLWQSFDYPSDTHLPGILLGFDSKSGDTNFLTSWKSESDPSTGMFLVGLTPEVPSQIVVWINGSTPYWRSGPWDKSSYIGLPGTNNGYINGLKLDDNVRQETRYNFFNFGDTLAYSDISSDGILKLMYSEHGENWILDFVAQNNSCDKYAACGPFGICKSSESPTTPICKCLKGFAPKSHEEWSKGNRTGGCVRQTKLVCETNTNQSVASRKTEDGFLKMVRLKVPDFHEYITSLDAEECRTHCLKNCSCLAYAYVNNIGCLVWSKDLIDMQEFAYGGEDLFVRLDRSELGNARLTDTFKNTRDTLQEYIRKHDPSELFIYNFDSILIATNNFSITNKLGEGGFGPVYKGKLEEGKEIAVKRPSSSSGQGMEEFKNEMLLISKLQHKNLVRIMGCCVKDDEKLLIYEFMPNRSLDTLIFNFGLSRIVEATQSLSNTHKVVGTLGYMSPEYAMGGVFSEKSDVYSFGILLLEIISGSKITSFYYSEEQLGFLAYAWQLWNEGRGLKFVDEVLADSYSSSEVTRCMHIGLLCVQDKAADRPTMPDVVFMLSSEKDPPPPKQPIFSNFEN
ncbi:hypothetical protein C1H46_034720 [Malus baccata]|uniref:non-specific serine/threonine protein kinase n=1 Tax=Malus baccata TaxID=106549 RepID=A0A540KZT8_MALBA|nr:hypothetical protein C1H46_034720 [Malus baccata]